jgi:chromosome partitioning protein
MKVLALFNNKGGVGKTSLAYHLAWMFTEKGVRTVAADFDPQANLTSVCLTEERLEEIWSKSPRQTVLGAISPLKKGIGDIGNLEIEALSERFGLIVGDLALSEFEDDLSTEWPKCLEGNERSFRVATALYRVLAGAVKKHNAPLAIVDVGPNLGAINRAALICADYVAVPVAADLFSIQGLENVGPKLRDWRKQWDDRKERAPNLDFDLPAGAMEPIGYVISRHTIFSGRPVKAFQKWIERLPGVYARSVLNKRTASAFAENDPNRLARMKDYRSLMPMAQEAKKPMFLLKPADGAIGGHQAAVQDCYRDFYGLAKEIGRRIGLAVP